ncbi:MAG: YtxH domain-containing protein [Bacteroidales bacterium]|jgi:gas vesicle protein|nr:YtxH domain-containing protein [Bacteroidales bacterium]
MRGDTLLAFIGGAIVGAAAAILFAPDAGTETRKKIKETLDKEYQNLKSKLNQEEPAPAEAECAEK